MSIFLSILMWTGIVLGGALALAVASFVVYFIWTLFTGSSPQGVEVEVICPVLIPTGDPFVMTVLVRNLLDRERAFRSLDFEHSLLKGFVIEKVEPNSRETSSAYGTTAYHFELPIPARASVKFTLQCHALEPGDFSGDIMIFVDQKHWKHVTKSHRVVVR